MTNRQFSAEMSPGACRIIFTKLLSKFIYPPESLLSKTRNNPSSTELWIGLLRLSTVMFDNFSNARKSLDEGKLSCPKEIDFKRYFREYIRSNFRDTWGFESISAAVNWEWIIETRSYEYSRKNNWHKIALKTRLVFETDRNLKN